jgi:PTH1 family peptidyl-tRNA hydrolase
MSLRSLISGWFRGRRSPASVHDQGAIPDRVVMGLGNPGGEYADTRHNVGFRVVERLAERHGGVWSAAPGLEARVASIHLGGMQCLLVEPQTFMNRSGRTATAMLSRFPTLDPAQNLLVVFDDLDLPPGRIRLRADGGAGGQRGMRDILEALDSRTVPRLRFGVGHPGQGGEAVVDWVLSPFDAADQRGVEQAVERAADAIEVALQQGLTAAMERFNAKA